MKRLILLITIFNFSISTSYSQVVFRSDIKANHIEYDSKRKVIYATVQENDSIYGNSIIAIDPYEGTVAKSVFVGKDPTTFVFTSDSNFIYIAFNNDAVVKKFSLNEFCIVDQINLETDSSNGERYANSLAVLPNNDSVIVVSTKFKNISLSFAGLFAYSNGKLLPNAIYPDFYFNEGVIIIHNLISTGNDTIYGYSENLSPSTFSTIKFNADSGLTLVSYKKHSIVDFSNLSYDDGLLYNDIGFIINPQNLSITDHFSLPFGYQSFTHCVDPISNRVFFYTLSGSDLYFVVYDISTLSKIRELKIPLDNVFLYFFCNGFIRSGKNGFSLILKNSSALSNDDLIIISINDIDQNLSSNIESGYNQNLYTNRILTNPVSDILNVEINTPLHGLYRVKIFDINGRVIKEVQFEGLNLGINLLNIDISNVKKGSYNILIFRDNLVLSSHKIIKI